MKKLFLVLLFSILTILPCYAVNIRYVDPDSAGGDGTTNALTGVNAAYPSLNAWEAARQGVLTDIEECICESNGGAHTADTTAVTIDGWTTTADYYIYIHTSAEGRHDGKWNTGKYILRAAGSHVLRIFEPFVRIDGLQIDNNYTGASGHSGISISMTAVETSSDIRISHCIITKTAAATGSQNGIDWGGDANITNGVLKLWNNIISNYILGTNAYGSYFYEGDITVYFYNNTVHNCKVGLYRHDIGAPTVVAKNSLFHSCTTAAGGTFAAGTDYNATNNASMGYTVTGSGNTHDRLSQTFTFADEAGDDFHLALADLGARGYGLSQYSDANCPVTTDIDGNYRRPNAEVTDIGADEDIDTLDSVSVRISNIQQSGTRYTTLFDWEADRDGVITGYYPEVAQIDGAWTAADTTAVTITDWTTDATHYIKVYTTTAARHDGKWNEGKYRLSGNNQGGMINNYEDYVRVDGLQISNSNTDYTRGFTQSANPTADNNGIYISNNIIKSAAASRGGAYGGYGGIHISKDDTSVYIWNNVIYDIADVYGEGMGIYFVGYSGNGYIYNNTVYNCNTGFNVGNYSTNLLKNNISYNNTDNYSSTSSTTSTNNLSGPQQTDAPGSNPRNGPNMFVTFVNESGDDFHLASNDAGARNYGVSDPGSGLFSDDIDGQTRPAESVWDIGADECVALVQPIINVF